MAMRQKIRSAVPGLKAEDENHTLSLVEDNLKKRDSVKDLEARKIVDAIEDEISLARQAGFKEAKLGENEEDKMFWLVAFNGIATITVAGMLYMVHFA